MAERRGRGFTTRAIHEAKTPPMDQETPSVPIYQTSTFRFADSDEYAETISFRKPGYTYTRGYGNPTLGAFEALMANLEGTEAAFSFSSGMAGMHAVFTTLAASGDRIVSSNELYGGAYSLFTKVMPRYGVTVDLVDPHDLDAVAEALPGAAFFYVETIANPNVTVADLEALGALCRSQGVPAVVDNTFASPYLANPSRWGFEYVVHSATKFIGGHNDLIGGVVCTSMDGFAALRETAIDTGGTMAPFEAWLCMRGLVTLELRMERHCASASRVAAFLEAHPKVERAGLPLVGLAPAARRRRTDPAARIRRHHRARGRRRRRGRQALLRLAGPGVGGHQPRWCAHARRSCRVHHASSDGSGGSPRARGSPTASCA